MRVVAGALLLLRWTSFKREKSKCKDSQILRMPSIAHKPSLCAIPSQTKPNHLTHTMYKRRRSPFKYILLPRSRKSPPPWGTLLNELLMSPLCHDIPSPLATIYLTDRSPYTQSRDHNIRNQKSRKSPCTRCAPFVLFDHSKNILTFVHKSNHLCKVIQATFHR